ncbi:MAG: 4Fe-4S dicluster domain-containing protein [Candidatus Methanolliviera sp. GoM_oil]|nr:MAG: 4Fe-4S dicluster domain-containing protein [Candidatus Methanolliviera sp. GoM_oil]
MISINRYKCGYCGACVAVCPAGAIELVEAWIEIDGESCVECNNCVKICPIGALEVSDEPKK